MRQRLDVRSRVHGAACMLYLDYSPEQLRATAAKIAREIPGGLGMADLLDLAAAKIEEWEAEGNSKQPLEANGRS